jgi:hypothetical protein
MYTHTVQACSLSIQIKLKIKMYKTVVLHVCETSSFTLREKHLKKSIEKNI